MDVKSLTQNASKNRIIYLDIIKIIASFCVIIIHIAGINSYDNFGSGSWIINNTYNVFSKWSVPAFVMVTGALLLKNQPSPTKICKNYVPRILLLIFFWGIFYWLFNKGDLNLDVGAAFLNVIRGRLYYHLWYLPMLLGLYIFTPFISTYVKNAKHNELRLLILICFITLIAIPDAFKLIPFFKENFEGSYNSVKLILNPAGYFIYYIAGYYFSNFSLSKKQRIMLYVSSTGLLCAAAMYSNILARIHRDGFYGSFDQFSIPTCLFTFAVFVFIREISSNIKLDTPLTRFINLTARLTLGIYLIHVVFVDLLSYLSYTQTPLKTLFFVPLSSFAVFIVSFVITYILYKIPGIKKLVS